MLYPRAVYRFRVGRKENIVPVPHPGHRCSLHIIGRLPLIPVALNRSRHDATCLVAAMDAASPAVATDTRELDHRLELKHLALSR
jgi:hypothetical protein